MISHPDVGELTREYIRSHQLDCDGITEHTPSFIEQTLDSFDLSMYICHMQTCGTCQTNQRDAYRKLVCSMEGLNMQLDSWKYARQLLDQPKVLEGYEQDKGFSVDAAKEKIDGQIRRCECEIDNFEQNQAKNLVNLFINPSAVQRI